jgi:hypothetical protein
MTGVLGGSCCSWFWVGSRMGGKAFGYGGRPDGWGAIIKIQ